MFHLTLYFLGYFICLFLGLFVWSTIIISLFGPPIVPTPKKIIQEALAAVAPKKGDFFMDLGSGSGRVVRMAVEKYKVRGRGIERNPFLVWWSKTKAFLNKLENIEFKRGDYLKADLSKADIIFMYLLPEFLPPVVRKIQNECKKGTIIISQRFFVKEWKSCLIKKISRENNSTYIYKIC